MADTYVRLYDGREPDTNVIGASANAYGALQNKRIHTFLIDQGYQIRKLPESVKELGVNATAAELKAILPEGSRSCAHLEVYPPLSLEDSLALGGIFSALIDPYMDEGLFVDNRQTSVLRGTALLRW